jgi:YHS domain-containing protein
LYEVVDGLQNIKLWRDSVEEELEVSKYLNSSLLKTVEEHKEKNRELKRIIKAQKKELKALRKSLSLEGQTFKRKREADDFSVLTQTHEMEEFDVVELDLPLTLKELETGVSDSGVGHEVISIHSEDDFEVDYRNVIVKMETLTLADLASEVVEPEVEHEVEPEVEHVEEVVVEEVVVEVVEETVEEVVEEEVVEDVEEEEEVVVEDVEEEEEVVEETVEEEEEVVEETVEEEEEVVEEKTEINKNITENVMEVEEDEYYETEIQGKKYYISNETNSVIYAFEESEEIGDVVGQYVDGKPVFHAVTKEEKVAEEVAEEEVAEEEEEEFYMIKIKNIRYYITNETDSEIYSYGKDGDLGELVGKYVNGKPTFE